MLIKSLLRGGRALDWTLQQPLPTAHGSSLVWQDWLAKTLHLQAQGLLVTEIRVVAGSNHPSSDVRAVWCMFAVQYPVCCRQ
jgi:hypothetical protein